MNFADARIAQHKGDPVPDNHRAPYNGLTGAKHPAAQYRKQILRRYVCIRLCDRTTASRPLEYWRVSQWQVVTAVAPITDPKTVL